MIDTRAESIDAAFSHLSPRDEEALVSLPYRVGLFVSHADTTGGWEAQDKEMQSLTNILRQYAEDYCKSELAQKVLMESLRQRQQWPAWSQNIAGVPGEAQAVMGILTPLFPDKQLDSFREVLIDIAMSVAMAFREGSGRVEKPSLMNGLLSMISRSPSGPLEHMNISLQERRAVNRLCQAMGYAAR